MEVIVKVGDLVKLNRRTRFTGGETLQKGEMGVVVKRSYLAYEADECKWLVMFGDSLRSVTQRALEKIVSEDESG